MSEEPRSDDGRSFDPSSPDSLHKDLPFGMAGVTAMLERLRVGVEHAAEGGQLGWDHRRCHAVADYLLSLQPEYWFSGEELAYCRRIVAN